MRLIELEPQFLKVTENGWRSVEAKADADGIRFLCPKCFGANHGAAGTHGVICWSPSVSQDMGPKPGRWEMHGTGYDDLTLVAPSSSVQLNGGCNAHFFVQNGGITFS